MKYQTIFMATALLATSSLAMPAEDLLSRSVGGSCSAPEGKGTCQKTSKCSGISYSQPFCPNDPADVQCCVEHKCTVSGKSGMCRNTGQGCSGGSFHKGTSAPWPCPGGDDIQCCIKDSGGSSPPPPAPTSGDVGAKILAKAETAKGTPYAWGGGSCKGPTHDQPPWEYGDIGYDCSGLVCWALCQVTGRDLFKAGLRNTHNMYCASEKTLGYKKYPYKDRKPGDAVFFGPNCDCKNSQDIHHVGLVADNLDKMWNAPDDQINKVLESDIMSSHCPDVIRFT